MQFNTHSYIKVYEFIFHNKKKRNGYKSFRFFLNINYIYYMQPKPQDVAFCLSSSALSVNSQGTFISVLPM